MVPDASDKQLRLTSFALLFQVERHHSDKTFTCVAEHPTFERQDSWPKLFGGQLRRSVRLEVQFEPDVELQRIEPSPIHEHDSLTFNCEAIGNPNVLTYRWFIDDQPVMNISGPQLRFESVTRQLHLREIKCQVSNAVGTRSASERLEIRYSAAFVSHLLATSVDLAEGHQYHQNHHQSIAMTKSQAQVAPISAPPSLAQQLSYSYDQGQDFDIRCDFDANPKVQQILWYKISSDYPDMKEVTHEHANQLISFGLIGAVLMAPQVNPMGTRYEPDYETISSLLIRELDEPERQSELTSSGVNPNGRVNGTSVFTKAIERVGSKPLTSIGAPIWEPLDWRTVESSSQELEFGSSSSHNETLDESGATMKAVEPKLSVKLMNNTYGQPKLSQRQAQISRSSISFKNANLDFMGKYVCRSKQADSSKPDFARAISVVMRQRPRIISTQSQWATLGSRQLRVECLVQVSGQMDNQTKISWFRDGQVSFTLSSEPSNTFNIAYD